jgi:hypothetical protein
MTVAAATPAQVDKYAKEYLDLKDQVLQAKFALTELQQQLELKAEIVKSYVESYGSAHAEKSKIVHGLKYEAVMTFGQSVSIDAAAVETFRDELRKSKQVRLLGKLFEKRISFALNPEASKIVRGSTLSDKLRSLFAKCEVIKPRTPTLQVREKEKAA